MKWKEKLKKLLPKRKNKEKGLVVPQQWWNNKKTVHTKVGKQLVTLEVKQPGKYRIRGLRTAKRVIAAVMLIFNFAISQACLLGAVATQPLFWFFILNTFIFLDYLWKTRSKPSLEEYIP